MVFESNMRQGGDTDLDLMQDSSDPGQFGLQWELRATAQEATLKDRAKSKSRRLSARNKTRERAGVAW